MTKTEAKRKISICNQMINIHKQSNSFSSKNAISCWNIKKRNLQKHLIKS
jgi:hypothetical protein